MQLRRSHRARGWWVTVERNPGEFESTLYSYRWVARVDAWLSRLVGLKVYPVHRAEAHEAFMRRLTARGL